MEAMRAGPKPMAEKRLYMGRFSAIVRLAVLAALVTASFIALGDRALATQGDPLLPDLRTLRPSELSLEYRAKTQDLILRFSNTVANHGVGPIEVRADPSAVDCNDDGDVNDHLAFQRIYEDGSGASDNGYYDTGDGYADTAPGSAGCKYYHPVHHHWHLTDFARYKLIRMSTGRVVRRATKVSFCLLDTIQPYPSLPGSPQNGRYAPNCNELAPQGISIGWADIYSSFLPGQSFDVTGLRRGRYCLLSTVDPKNHLQELDDSNNSTGHRLFLHPKKRKVTPGKRGCRTG